MEHCWYSKTQDQLTGHAIYLINGKEQKVTVVSKDIKDKFNIADSVYLGMGEYVRSTSKNEEHVQSTFGHISNKLSPSYEDLKTLLFNIEQMKNPLNN